jgi:hypothetical protein
MPSTDYSATAELLLHLVTGILAYTYTNRSFSLILHSSVDLHFWKTFKILRTEIADNNCCCIHYFIQLAAEVSFVQRFLAVLNQSHSSHYVTSRL